MILRSRRRMKARRLRQTICLSLSVGLFVFTVSLVLQAVSRSNTFINDLSHRETLKLHTNSETTHTASHNSTWIILEADDSRYDASLWQLANQTSWNILVIREDGVVRCSQRYMCREMNKFRSTLKKPLVSMATMATSGIVNYSTTSSMPSTTKAATKLAAILYAVSSGALWIHVGWLDSLPVSKIANLTTIGGNRTGLVYPKPGYFSVERTHYSHVDDDVIPRAGRYKLNYVSSAGIVVFWDHCTSTILCSTANPPIHVTAGTVTSFPSSSSLLTHRNAFWVLLLTIYPDNHPGRAKMVSFLQRLLWETGQSLSISSSHHVHNEIILFCKRHSCSPDSLTKKISPKIRHSACLSIDKSNSSRSKSKAYHNINVWEVICKRNDSTFLECAEELNKSMFFNFRDAGVDFRIVSEWLRLLKSSTIKYRYPDRKSFTDATKPTASVQKGIPVWFTPSPCKPMNRMESAVKVTKSNRKVNKGQMNTGSSKQYKMTMPWSSAEECLQTNVSMRPEIPKRFKITDILLIVVFNFPYLVSHIPLLLNMYGRHFRHILFCGENFASFLKFYKMDRNPHVSFVEINHGQGTWGYSCMSAAIKMNYDVTGYLQMSDDVLLNVWSIKNAPRDKFWYQSRVRVANIRLDRLPDIATTNRWYPWIFVVGRYAAILAYRNLKQLTKRDAFYSPKVKRFLEQLGNTTQCSTCLLYEASDIFYVPKSFSQDFSLFVDVFHNSRLHLEIAIPTAIFGLSPETDVFRLRGNYVWGDERADFAKYYSRFDHFQHAWKLTRLATKEGMAFFCHDYLPWLEQDLTIP